MPSVQRCKRNSTFAACNATAAQGWQWAPAAVACHASHKNGTQAQQLLAGKWLAMVGDSVTRNLFASLLRLMTGVMLAAAAAAGTSDQAAHASPAASAGGKHGVVYGHRDFEHSLPGKLRAAFIWSPYLANTTALLRNWWGPLARLPEPPSMEAARWLRPSKRCRSAAGRGPDILLVSAGLWHMLHNPSAAHFQAQLAEFTAAAQAYTAMQPVHARSRLSACPAWQPGCCAGARHSSCPAVCTCMATIARLAAALQAP